MRDKIKALEKVSKQLDPNTEIRADWNRDVLNYADNFIKQLDSTKAYSINESNGKGIYDQDITEHATDLKTLLKHTSKDIDAVGINPAAAGHMGYIPGGGLYPSALGDYIAAIHNRYAGIFYAAPGAVRLEDMLIRWMCNLMGYPNQAVGHLTSGGSIANLVAIVTARESQGLKAYDIPKAVIYLSEQTHHSIQKALRIAGLSEAQLRYIPLDEGLRLSISHLERAIVDDKANGLKPFFINASIGTTNTGAIDPIENIGKIAKRHHIWFHVDAAYGGFFRLVKKLAPKFEGVSEADSITLDPHKTLFLPFGTGAVLLKEKTHVLKAFYYLADYMQDTTDANEILSPADISPELTKHFRGMRLWLPLKLFGLKPFRAALEEKLLLTQYVHKELQKITGFDVGPEPELSVTMFRYVPETGDADDFNAKLIKAIQQDGRIFLSSTTINGIFWIRIAIVIFRTHLKQIDLLLEIIKEKVKALNEI